MTRVTVLSLFTLLFTTLAYPQTDINGDGVLNGLDVRALGEHLLGERGAVPEFDVNGDGGIDVSDLVQLINVYGVDPMIPVAGTTFPMGNPSATAYYVETPVHDVTLREFEIGRNKITLEEYTDFLNTAWQAGEIYVLDGYVRSITHDSPLLRANIGQDEITFSLSRGFAYPEGRDDWPVLQITWEGAADYCNRLSRRDGLEPVYTEEGWWPGDTNRSGYHLPTEAQWECAAGWDDEQMRHWFYANSSDVIENEIINTYRYPIGFFSEMISPVGCQDMGVNAVSWCHDWFDPVYYTNSPSLNPTGSPERVPPYGGRSVRGPDTYGRWGSTGLGGIRLARSFIDDMTAIAIDVIPDEGSWTLTGPEGYTLTGSGDRLGNDMLFYLPPGEYTLTCDDNIVGMNPPAPQSGSLDLNRRLSLGALYSFADGIPEPGMVAVFNEEPFHRGDRFDEGSDDELPARAITLSDYVIGRYEITLDEYVTFLNTALVAGEITINSGLVYLVGNSEHPLCRIGPHDTFTMIEYNGVGFFLPDKEGVEVGDFPVMRVTWYGAAAYCNWLSRQHGFDEVYTPFGDWASDLSRNGYHLPTEAQWEKAASWESEGLKHWRYGHSSDTISFDEANYDKANPLGFSEYPYLSPVGYFTESVSPYGCFDMSGNVGEFCNDWYDADYYDFSTPDTDPAGPLTGERRVYRGGDWTHDVDRCRTSDRSSHSPDNTLAYYVGFRLSRNP